MGALERVTSSEPVTATVLPQLSAGPGASSSATVRLLEWTEASAPPPGSGLRVSARGDWLGNLSCSSGRSLGQKNRLAEMTNPGAGVLSRGLWGVAWVEALPGP